MPCDLQLNNPSTLVSVEKLANRSSKFVAGPQILMWSSIGFGRGLRPRSDRKVFYAFAIALGASSGYYSFFEMNAKEIAIHQANQAAAAVAAESNPK